MRFSSRNNAALWFWWAPAIYLHTGDAEIPVPAFTSDGDLAMELTWDLVSIRAVFPARGPEERPPISCQGSSS